MPGIPPEKVLSLFTFSGSKTYPVPRTLVFRFITDARIPVFASGNQRMYFISRAIPAAIWSILAPIAPGPGGRRHFRTDQDQALLGRIGETTQFFTVQFRGYGNSAHSAALCNHGSTEPCVNLCQLEIF